MLTSISIRNLVTIESLQLELDGGMNALTGETSAGKSILIDALGMVLGDKADTGLIRHGAEKAEISADFDISGLSAVSDWLEQNALEADGECLLRRIVSNKGRSRAFINGTPVTLANLSELGSRLVDIHGQHAHQSLVHRNHQRILLDAYAGNGKLVAQTAESWREWKSIGAELQALEQAQQERDSRLDLLRFQVDELQQLDLKPEEWQTLETDQKRLSNAENLQGDSRQLLALLYEDDGARDQLQRAMRLAESMAQSDDELPTDALSMLNSALIELDESAALLQQYADTIDLDPQRLQEVDNRMSNLMQAARKHRIEPKTLTSRLQELEEQLDGIENSGAQLEALKQRQAELADQWNTHAIKLGKRRARAAKALSKTVSATMQTLSMPNGAFSVNILAAEDAIPREHGLETIGFMVSTNPGQPPQSLSKAASGGELSRISLAIQVATIGLSSIPTLIFDEVDVGIGGGVAEIVGNLLRQLGEQRQILCVTHLPQVAAQAHQHLRVEKESGKGKSRTAVVMLDEEHRIQEIARMLGGLELTKKTLDHAREMVLKTG